mgnify:CR=1 FL=1
MNQQTTNRDTGEAAAANAPANSATSTSTPDNQPTPLDAFEVLLITGMSGAGRSHAADCVEDMGWYVVDNLPPKLLIPLVDMMTTSGSGSESGVHKLAAVIDVRSSYSTSWPPCSAIWMISRKTRILFPRRQQRSAHQALRIRAPPAPAAARQPTDRRHP